MMLDSIPRGGRAVVIGASGGIGAALENALHGTVFDQVLGMSRATIDITDEASIATMAASIAADTRPIRLIIVATGLLAGQGIAPEKSWRDLDVSALSQSFAINTIGPALVMKHFLPLLPRDGKSVFAALSARVGSIGDNRLGGWYGYRASKAALNQMICTAAVELTRSRPDAICVALHPGTVATPLSAPFIKSGLDIQTPEVAAASLLQTIDALGAADSGGFYDQRGHAIAF
jgi:NAD(P)-dependent dehydrogenase (short-subunit alcohol dehydrogenase family)